MWKVYMCIVSMLIISCGCATYEAKEVPIQKAEEYKDESTISGVTITVDSYDNKDKAESAFYVDTTKKNIRPILIVIENKSSDSYSINRSDITLKDKTGKSYEPVTSNYAFGKFGHNEFLWGALFGLFGTLSAHDANQRMKEDWNQKEIVEKLILKPNSKASGFVFFETDEPILGNMVIINALNLRTNEMSNFKLQVM